MVRGKRRRGVDPGKVVSRSARLFGVHMCETFSAFLPILPPTLADVCCAAGAAHGETERAETATGTATTLRAAAQRSVRTLSRQRGRHVAGRCATYLLPAAACPRTPRAHPRPLLRIKRGAKSGQRRLGSGRKRGAWRNRVVGKPTLCSSNTHPGCAGGLCRPIAGARNGADGRRGGHSGAGDVRESRGTMRDVPWSEQGDCS